MSKRSTQENRPTDEKKVFTTTDSYDSLDWKRQHYKFCCKQFTDCIRSMQYVIIIKSYFIFKPPLYGGLKMVLHAERYWLLKVFNTVNQWNSKT